MDSRCRARSKNTDGVLLALTLQGGAESKPVDRLDELLDANLGGIERHSGSLVPKAHVGPTHTLEPFQGSLDRHGSRPSGHALDSQHHGGCRRQCHLGEEEEENKESSENGFPHHGVPFSPIWC